jgi:glycerophosphoryl diester phosphodiesterase
MGTTRRLRNVAHRGASADRPENTIAAFELAIAQGADVIECDVRATSDRALLVLHDATLERTTSGSGPLRAMTAVEARRWTRVRADPAAGRVLELARGRARNVDLKEADR